MKKLFSLLAVLVVCLAALTVTALAADSGLEMTTAGGCYYYSSQSSAEANRAGYLTYGTDLTVSELGETYAKIEYNGGTYYILASNLNYLSYTVQTDGAPFGHMAGSWSEADVLGYLPYGTQLDLLGITTGSNGVDYLYCRAPQLYNEDGSEGDTDVPGYISMGDVQRSGTPMVATGGKSLYGYAFSSSDDSSLKTAVGTITTGEQVNVMMSRNGWSKIQWLGGEYFIYTSNLTDLTRAVTADRATLYAKPDTTSGVLDYGYWNETVTVLGTCGSFTYCRLGDQTGFMPSAQVGTNRQMKTNNAGSVYLSADSADTKLGTVLGGETVYVPYSSGNWAHIVSGELEGFMPISRLEDTVCTANGGYYANAQTLYEQGTADGTLNGQVTLLALNETYGYAYVKDESDACYWMDADSISVAEERRTVYVAGVLITLRAEPTNSSAGLEIPYMTEVELLEAVTTGTEGSWHKVEYQDQLYYVWVGKDETVFTETKSEYSYFDSNEIRQKLIRLAITIHSGWDTRFENGGTGEVDEDGCHLFDCSGFSSYLLNTVMADYLPTYRVSANLQTQLNTTGIYNEGYPGAFSAFEVAQSELKAGDVLFFDLEDDETVVDHCGVYLGNNEFIHSTISWDTGVYIMPLTGSYSRALVCIKRFLPEQVTAADTPMYANAATVKLYSQKADSSEVLKTLSWGDRVTVNFTDNGNWAAVTAEDGTEGFILVRFLSATAATLDKTAPTVSLSIKAANGKPQLKWNAVTGAEKYEIWRAEGKNSGYTKVYTTTSTSYTNTSAYVGKTYYYKVRAVSGDEKGNFSAAKYITCDCAQPVTTLKIKTANGKPQLSWNAVTGASKYEVWRAEGKNSGYTKMLTTTGTIYTNTSAVAGKTYYYKVRAICSATTAGNSAFSAAKYITCDCAQPVVTVKLNTSDKPRLSWEKVTGASKYEVWRAVGQDSGYKKIYTMTGNVFTNTSVQAGETYYYKVRAVCSATTAGNSAFSASKSVTVPTGFAITAQPASLEATMGSLAKFTVKATGEGLKYQWQYCTATGTKWNNTTLTGNKTDTLSVGATEGRDGYKYRCVITDANANKLTSAAATLTVVEKLEITNQPQSVSVLAGEVAQFDVEAYGTDITYQWQYCTATGTTWKNTTLTGNKTEVLSVTATSGRNGYKYRCILTDKYGDTVTSDAATLTVLQGVKITAQPEDVSAAVGETARFTVGASGSGLTYQWQYRASASGTWKNTTLTGNKTAELSVGATAGRDGYQYRCVITDENGITVASDGAALTVRAAVSAPEITLQPMSQWLEAGMTVWFSVEINEEGASFQWQRRVSDSAEWMDADEEGYNTSVLSLQASDARDGYQYRCIITGENGAQVTSDAATLNVVEFVKVVVSPANVSAAEGETAQFTVGVSGTVGSYRWQYLAVGSEDWLTASDYEGAYTDTLSVPAAAHLNGYQFRCFVIGIYGETATSAAAVLSVE